MRKIKNWKQYNENSKVVKLNESPNSFKLWGYSNQITFLYYNNKFYSHYEENENVEFKSHVALLMDITDEPQGVSGSRELLSGRLFIDSNMITFWTFPKDNKELKRVADDIKKHHGIDIWNDEWKIEIIENVDDVRDFTAWSPDKYKTKIIPIKEYKSSEERSKEELKIPHLLDSTKKHKALKDIGYRSKTREEPGGSPIQYRHKVTRQKFNESVSGYFIANYGIKYMKISGEFVVESNPEILLQELNSSGFNLGSGHEIIELLRIDNQNYILRLEPYTGHFTQVVYLKRF